MGVVDVVLNLEKQTMVTCNKDSVGRFFHETLGELAAKVACQKFNMVWGVVVGGPSVVSAGGPQKGR